MIGTPNEQRRKIREQLKYELALPEIPKKKRNKSKMSLPSTRAKWLSNPKNLKPEGEKPL
jgi:hypothetical protein